MIQIRHERLSDIDAREALLDNAFGESRYRKSSERLREDRLPAEGLSFIASEGRRVIGTARLWDIALGNGQKALLLGPVAVAEDCRSRGLGGALVRRAIQTARKLGFGAVILVGDPEFYNRFGFSGEKTGALWMPGPFERHRLLGRELTAGALDGARGMIAPTGRHSASKTRVDALTTPLPDLAALVAQASRAHAPRGHRSR
ncbi:MAG: N-acetyltransferase, partial [Hyphomicrobiales bacterium]|nr:N-acetyltransferase [Hyphomicrobiales bacterium]